MASVYRTQNSIEVRAYAGRDDVTGSVRNLYRSLPPDAHQCEIEEAKRQLQQTADSFKGNGEPFTLKGVLEYYFDSLEGQRSPTYIDGLRSNARCHIYPAIGRRRVETIRPYEIIGIYNSMRAPKSRGGKGLSPNTVVKLNGWLRHAFEELTAMGIMRSNPLDGLGTPKAAKSEAMALTERDLAAFSSWLKEAKEKGELTELDSALWLCLNTGFRAGELAGLRIDDVRQASGEVRVSSSLARAAGRGLFYKRPKSTTSRRTVTVGASTMDVLRRSVGRAKRLSRSPNPPLFCDMKGNPHDPRDFSRRFREVADGLGVGKYAHLHTLRHTHATYLLLNGTPIRVVQERLGHADVRTTLQIYGHVLPGYDREAADRFDTILEGIS